MKKQTWLVILAVVILSGGFGGRVLYNEWRMDVFREGYLRGSRHAEIYFKQKGKFPPLKWQLLAFRFVNREDWWRVESVIPSRDGISVMYFNDISGGLVKMCRKATDDDWNEKSCLVDY